MTNLCQFSPDRRYRYTLEHVIDEVLPPRVIMWTGLNPSTACEDKLDNTLRRIRRFSADWGFTSFVMTNLFAFRATQPAVMKQEADPVGPDNDRHLLDQARRCDVIVAMWGTHGRHLKRDDAVFQLLFNAGLSNRLHCLHENHDGTPSHCLYLPTNSQLRTYR